MTERKRGAEVKFCIVCGRRIPENSPRHKICSDRCALKRRRLARRGMAAPYEYSKEPPIAAFSLGEIQRRAKMEGLSYGQFMSRVHSGGIKFEGIKAVNRELF